MALTTEDAAAQYATFSNARLLDAAADLARLGDSDPDVVAARPALDAELWYRGLK